MRRKVDRDRRVVVTGVGLVTPLGTGVEKNWEALTAGRSGIGPITRFDTSDFASRIAGEVRDFNPLDWIEKKEVKKMDLFIQYAMGAAEQAMRQSGLKIDEDNAGHVGVLVGVGIGGLITIEENHLIFLESRLKRSTPFFIPKLISNLAPGHIAIRYGARGANLTTTSACASGSHAVGEAYRMIRGGYLDAAITGGAEAALCSLGVGGFVAMRALSTRNESPETASRPFDRERDGFVMSEGAAALILEERDQAIARGAKILAEIVGYASNADAYHITSPSPEGHGAAKCMQLCLDDGNLEPAGRRGRDPGDQARIRRACGENRGELDQVDDGAYARCGGRYRIGIHRAHGRARCAPAHYKSRISRPGVRPRLRSEPRASREDSARVEQLLRIRRGQHHPGFQASGAKLADAKDGFENRRHRARYAPHFNHQSRP